MTQYVKVLPLMCVPVGFVVGVDTEKALNMLDAVDVSQTLQVK